MEKKKKIELKDELDDDLNFEGEKAADGSFCAKKGLLPWVWILGILVLVVILFAVFGHDAPSPHRIAEAWGEPEKTIKLLNQQVVYGNQVVAWSQGGRSFACPNCGWRGTRLAIDSSGNYICPQCFYRPFQRNVPLGRGAAAITSASPQVILVKELGIEVVDTQRGVLVAQAYGGSWAEKGGLKHGDIILKFNHRGVSNTAKFQKLVQSAPPERRVPVKVSRVGKTVKLNVIVGEGEMEGVTLPGQAGAAVAWAQEGQGGMPVSPAGRGGYGLGQGGYIVCPNCRFKMLHQRGVPAYSVRCPKCGSTMVKEEILQQVGQTGGLAGFQGQGQYPWRPPR